MKKLLSIVLISSLVLVSCDFDKDFEEMNVDPTKAAQLDVNNKLASVFLRTSGERYENWRASFYLFFSDCTAYVFYSHLLDWKFLY